MRMLNGIFLLFYILQHHIELKYLLERVENGPKSHTIFGQIIYNYDVPIRATYVLGYKVKC